MPHLYVAPWEWRAEPTLAYWRAPGGGQLGSLDMRTIPARSLQGGPPQGFGLFTYQEQQVIPGSLYLGTDPTAMLSLVQRSTIEAFLNTTFAETRLDRMLVEAFQDQNKWDATGQSRWRPAQVSSREAFRIYLGGFGVLFEEPLSEASRIATIAVFQADYRRQRPLLPLSVLRCWTGATMQALYGYMGDALLGVLPAEYQSDGWAPPASRVDDNFNRADANLDGSTTSDGKSTWTEWLGTAWAIVSNAARVTGSTARQGARVNLDLGSANHECQATLKTLTRVAGNMVGETLCRKDSTTAETGYICGSVFATSIINRVHSDVAGAITQLGADGSALVAGDTVRIRADGSSISGYKNGVVDIGPVTDTGITGNLRCGLFGLLGSGSNVIDMDDWYGQDLELEYPAGHDKSRMNVLVRM